MALQIHRGTEPRSHTHRCLEAGDAGRHLSWLTAPCAPDGRSLNGHELNRTYRPFDAGNGRSSPLESDEADPYTVADITSNRLLNDGRHVDLPAVDLG